MDFCNFPLDHGTTYYFNTLSIVLGKWRGLFQNLLYKGHGSNTSDAMKCIYDNVHDIQLKAWIFRIFNRGFMYYLTQYFNEVIDVSLKIWSFISEFVSIVLTYSDIYIRIMAFFILHYISTEILVS